MMRNRIKLSEQVRRAVAGSGVSRYSICKAAAVDQGTLSRFMAGKIGLSWQSLDALAEVLGLGLVACRPVKVLPPAKRGPKPKGAKRGKRV